MEAWEQKENVMDAIREQSLDADIIFACGPTPMLRAIKTYAEEKGNRMLYFSGRENGMRYRSLSGMCLQDKRKKMHTVM